MITLSKEDEQRNWINQGLAKFADLLRLTKQENSALLFDQVISSLVTYLKINQGAIFLINDDRPSDPYIELVSCYAYQRKKHLNKRIELGGGLVGQCFMEKQVIYMTDVPQNYIKITSGLGEALPRCVLLVPMMLEDQVLGVTELASFKPFEQYQIDFMKRVAENMASTFMSARTSMRTQKLLKESQIQAERLRAQEEEMRQNMEELTATQDEMEHNANEVLLANADLERAKTLLTLISKTSTEGLWDMDVPEDMQFTDDTPFNWYDRFRQMLGFDNEKSFPNILGSWSSRLHPDHKQQTLEAFGKHLKDFSGKTPYDVEYQLQLKDGSYKWFRAVGNTLRDEKGFPKRVAGSLIDIQNIKDIQKNRKMEITS